MNGVKYLLDSNIIIGLVKANPSAIAMIQNLELCHCAYASITRMELLGFFGITKEEKSNIAQLLNKMISIELSRIVEEEVIILRQQQKMKLPDAIILATAQVFQLGLITLDKKLEKISKEQL